MYEKEKELLKVFNELSTEANKKEENQRRLEKISKATSNVDIETCKEIIKENAGCDFQAMFGGNLIIYANKMRMMKAENEKLQKKVPVENETAKSLDLLGNALVEAIKQTKGDELIDYAKKFIEANYGIVEKKITYVTPSKKKFSEVTHERFEDVLDYIQNDISVMMVGPAGTGKNVLAKQIAKALDYNYYESNAVQNTFQLTGFIDANGKYQDTEFYKACKSASEGKETLFVFDEIDASTSEVMVEFNNALANGEFEFPNGTLEFKGKLHFVACANTFGEGASFEYVGRNQLDKATLDRFATVYIDYSTKIEDSLTQNRELLDFVRDFRKCVNKSGIKHIVSYRALIRLDKMLQVERTDDRTKSILQECLLKNLEQNDLGMICNELKSNQYARLVKELANA